MSKRITVMIDDDIERKVRLIQSRRIDKENSAISFSRTLNDELKKHFGKRL